ncbi:hypothetical protein HK097_001465 [Rhizophlyctis rosea]|uniref:BTB domain-containing protein n=1 Tax=Rhizophlyctis rosea TaxID=64517 RepID=A0AAD5WYB0_9FUNG|nr:hypothetical protein HK097_001465 [Rhizophlyctis rosea]
MACQERDHVSACDSRINGLITLIHKTIQDCENGIQDTPPGVPTVDRPLCFKSLSVDTSLQPLANNRILSLLETGTDADVRLQVGPEESEIMAHRWDDILTTVLTLEASSILTKLSPSSLILKAASDFFASALSGNWAEGKTNEIKIQSIEPTVMRVVLEYIYGGVLKMSDELVQTLDLYDALKYLCLPEACAVIRANLVSTLLSIDPVQLPKYWSEIEKRNHADLHETGLEVFSQLMRRACQVPVCEPLVRAIAKIVETVEDAVKVLKGAWKVVEPVEGSRSPERRRQGSEDGQTDDV